MKNKVEVIKLFRKYGFEHRDSASNSDYLAFTYKAGFFHNAELVSLCKDERQRIEREMDFSVRQLESLGFSTKKSFYNSIEEIEDVLFYGFFNVEQWKEKICREYSEHCKKILSALPPGELTYSYINSPFLKNGNNIDLDLVSDVCESLGEVGPQLSIIEAPGGFGKTCTSYEIINTLALKGGRAPIPFFTEFSRDRQARIFSHILVREVDRSFNSVSSSVVIEEVKSGRIVIVLDGFDEILHDSSANLDSETSFEEAEPMLETIGELLTNNAKIILTSRKSAIFDGEVFGEWVQRYNDKFKINRYRLERPEIRDWLSPQRMENISETDIDLTRLANPVLLSYLRFVDDQTFRSLCENTERIVEHYFKSMLEREMERQELRMSPDQQKEFLRIIASDMCNKNYTSDTKENLINTIKDKVGHLINEVRKLYSAKDRPTIDKLATTLSNHAFFDRCSGDDSQIEFINEFVFGNYISENIISESNWLSDDERFVEPAVQSYVPRSRVERARLWAGLSEMKMFLDASSRMRSEWLLTGRIVESSYDDVEISSVDFRSCGFFQDDGAIKNSVFNRCSFNECSFNFVKFFDVTFIDCSFWDCVHGGLHGEAAFYNCKSNNSFVSLDNQDEEFHPEADLTDVEVYILTRMWPIGSPTIERLHHFIGVILKTDEFSKKDILRGIKSLKRKKILREANNVNFIEINKERFGEIKIMLRRA